MYNKKYNQRNNRHQQPVKVSPATAKRNKKIIEKVDEWQNFKYIKHLICNNTNCGCKLKPKEINGRVVLQCPKCREIQSYIPKAVLQTKFYISEKLKRLQALYQSLFSLVD